MKRWSLFLCVLVWAGGACAQTAVKWPAGAAGEGLMVLNTSGPLISRVSLDGKVCLSDADPVFTLRVGKRDLVSQNGWNIFFDKVPLKGFETYALQVVPTAATVRREGARTVVRVGRVSAPGFTGWIEITLYHGSPLFNIAAVVSTQQDSTAILYDAGVVSGARLGSVRYYDVGGKVNVAAAANVAVATDTVMPMAVKYRAIAAGGLVVFPGPHQYFYPLDEAFNLKFVWYSRNGIGIRQEPYGDHRFVPWFNAPPGTEQRLNFFCLVGASEGAGLLDEVRRYTRDDKYLPLDGYKTMSSHFHNEYVMTEVMKGHTLLDTPSFVRVFKDMGVNIVHLAEFHGTGHPRGPDSLRLRELDALFAQCRRLSNDRFLLLPGEEPNEFFGGHWLSFFPKPVYWVMSRQPGAAFVTQDAKYGNVYRVGDTTDMLDLLRREHGLAWTAHPRTKGSTGYPDKYKFSTWFNSDRWLGGAWKALPADLSQPRLGKRVLDLMDDMNNWGLEKHPLAEADIFTIEPENEMYAHMNVNYLRFGKLPAFDQGWESILDTLRHGQFFSTTGEVLLPGFSASKVGVDVDLFWTFPLHFIEVISGDGAQVYRHRISMNDTKAFGHRHMHIPVGLSARKWVRIEAWDIAANGAFTQTVYLK